MPDRVSVSAADFVRNIGVWQEQALRTPVSITRHGKERLVLLSAERYESANGNAPAAMTLTAQAALLALSHVQEGYVAYDEDFAIVDLNRAAEAFFGIAREDLIGRRLMDVFPAAESSMAADQIRRVVATRAPATFEAESTIFEGVRLTVTVYPLLKGMGVLFTNITERDALRAAAARGQALLAALDEHRGVSVVQLDVRGRLTQLDAKFSLWSGFDPSALVNCRLIDLIAPADRRRVGDAFDESILARKATAVEATLIAKDLVERPLSISFSSLADGDGRLEVWAMLSLAAPGLASKAPGLST